MNESQTQTSSGNIAHAFNGTTGIFKNQGQGKIIYQFLVTGKRNINTIAIETDNSMSVCDFGTTSGFNDSSTQQVFYSIVCNVDLSNNNKAINLLIYGYAWEQTYINWGRTIQFSNFENGNDYTQVLSNVDANLNSISSAVWSIKSNSDLIKQYLQTMVNNNTTINNNVNDIKDSINEDVGNNYKQTPNQTDYNNYHQKEQSILGQISNTDTSAINIQNNNNANLFIWDTITRSLQSHAKVMALMISILSIGIIKLILNR